MGFHDLCINIDDDNEESMSQCLTTLHDMGYRTVAINQTIDESVFTVEQKTKKKSQCQSSKIVARNLQNLRGKFKGRLRILSRLTFVFSDPAKIHLLSQSNGLKDFDLFALLPRKQEAFQFACAQVNADIITFNASCSGFKFNKKLYSQAVERGLHFEIQYAELISPATQKIALKNSHTLYIYGKSKNVIVSSGAKDYLSIRDPYDIINLANILGLCESKAKAALLDQCKHLLSRADGRRFGKAIFSIETIKEKEADDSCEFYIDGVPDAKRLKISD